jgi:hypothetical protein
METGIEGGYKAHDNLERQKGNTERGGESGFHFRLTYGPIYRSVFNVHEGCPHELFSNHQLLCSQGMKRRTHPVHWKYMQHLMPFYIQGSHRDMRDNATRLDNNSWRKLPSTYKATSEAKLSVHLVDIAKLGLKRKVWLHTEVKVWMKEVVITRWGVWYRGVRMEENVCDLAWHWVIWCARCIRLKASEKDMAVTCPTAFCRIFNPSERELVQELSLLRYYSRTW